MTKSGERLPSKTPKKTTSPTMASKDVADVFKKMIDARKEYAIAREQEQSKRAEIAARMHVEMAKIAAAREEVSKALEQDFSIRRDSIEQMFQRLDKAMEEGKDELAIAAVQSIEGIVKESPVGGALQALAKSFESRDGVIDI